MITTAYTKLINADINRALVPSNKYTDPVCCFNSTAPMKEAEPDEKKYARLKKKNLTEPPGLNEKRLKTQKSTVTVAIISNAALIRPLIRCKLSRSMHTAPREPNSNQAFNRCFYFTENIKAVIVAAAQESLLSPIFHT
jgi:hypothetical protein